VHVRVCINLQIIKQGVEDDSDMKQSKFDSAIQIANFNRNQEKLKLKRIATVIPKDILGLELSFSFNILRIGNCTIEF
jgi:hypothetical protein